ncbi:hypothetical protein ACXYMX_15785 [Sporosarcina sp. CAU 1771]
MSSCPIDHKVEDVRQKLEDQQPHLPKSLYEKCKQFLEQASDQSVLNEVFHLLKKYDLATDEVKNERNSKLEKVI